MEFDGKTFSHTLNRKSHYMLVKALSDNATICFLVLLHNQ